MNNPLTRRRRAYQQAFPIINGRFVGPAHAVMADLARFCEANGTPAKISPITRTVDPIATGIAIGRREVFDRIKTMIHLEDYHLVNLREDND